MRAFVLLSIIFLSLDSARACMFHEGEYGYGYGHVEDFDYGQSSGTMNEFFKVDSTKVKNNKKNLYQGTKGFFDYKKKSKNDKNQNKKQLNIQ